MPITRCSTRYTSFDVKKGFQLTMQLLLQLRAAVRVGLVAIILGIGALAVLLLSLLPIRVGGARIAAYPVVWMARAFMWIFGIHYSCPEPAQVQKHHGMIFCNHSSFIDTLMVLYLTPARFLSTRGVRNLPLIGQIAVAIETVFVHRYNDEARAAARNDVADSLRQRTFPPLVLFPEGKIGPGHTLLPFRYGAFEIAKAEGVAILPCALLFEPLAPIAWHKSTETLPMMAWKLAALRHGLRAQLIPLSVIQLTPESDIPQIAEQTRQALQAVVSAGLVER